MRNRLAALLVLIVAGVMFAAVPASAQSAVPGIKQTPAFKKMKGYVEFLYDRRMKTVTPKKRQTFRTNLRGFRKNADLKANQLFSIRITQIARQDDVQERRQVRRIRVNQKRRVQAQQRALANRVSALKVKQNVAVQRIYNQYQPQINNLADQRDMLKRQLNRTTNPVKRAKLTQKINNLQTRINALVSDRTTDVSEVNARYNARTNSVTALFNARITKIRAQARKQIRQARNAWRRTFRTQLQAAKVRRGADKEIVASVAERGNGYIDQMPSPNQ